MSHTHVVTTKLAVLMDDTGEAGLRLLTAAFTNLPPHASVTLLHAVEHPQVSGFKRLLPHIKKSGPAKTEDEAQKALGEAAKEGPKAMEEWKKEGMEAVVEEGKEAVEDVKEPEEEGEAKPKEEGKAKEAEHAVGLRRFLSLGKGEKPKAEKTKAEKQPPKDEFSEVNAKLDDAGNQFLKNALCMAESFRVRLLLLPLFIVDSHTAPCLQKTNTAPFFPFMQHADGLLPQNVPLETRLIAGHNSKQKTVEFLDDHCFDLVFVGRRGFMKRALLGSFSHYIVSHCACNVTVVSMHVTEKHERGEAVPHVVAAEVKEAPKKEATKESVEEAQEAGAEKAEAEKLGA